MEENLNQTINAATDAASSKKTNDFLMNNLGTIITLAMLQEKGFKIARLSGNRTLDEKIVKAKKKSLKATGLLVPAIIVEADKAIEEGLEVVDFETGEQVTEENAKYYMVLVDANHRYMAHLQLLKEDKEYNNEFYFMFPLQNIKIKKMHSEINIATNQWKTADYGKGAAICSSEKLPLLNAINELTEQGYSVESASLWLTFEKKITKSILVNAMSGTIADSLKASDNIDRGMELLKAARKSFKEDFLKKRTMPDWIISRLKENEEGKTAFINKMCNFLSNITRETAGKVEDSKGTRGGDTKEAIVNRMLTEMWREFNNNNNN